MHCSACLAYTSNMLRKVIVFAGSILLSLAAGGIGSLATIPNIPSWYADLNKPPFLPPNEIFGPMWTLLYILMGVALGLVILHKAKDKKTAYAWFGVQLALNTLWSVVFFGLHLPWSAVAIIAMLIFSIVMTIRHFQRLVPATLWLLLPYLAWVCFATYLNTGVAVLN